MYLTIDVGGTKTLLATFSEAGEILEQLKFPTPKIYADFILELKSSIEKICGGENPISCAMALPASINREKGIAEYFGNLDWVNVPVADDLKDVLNCPEFCRIFSSLSIASARPSSAILLPYRLRLRSRKSLMALLTNCLVSFILI